MRVIERLSTPLPSADSNQPPHVQAESATVSSKIEGEDTVHRNVLGGVSYHLLSVTGSSDLYS